MGASLLERKQLKVRGSLFALSLKTSLAVGLADGIGDCFSWLEEKHPNKKFQVSREENCSCFFFFQKVFGLRRTLSDILQGGVQMSLDFGNATKTSLLQT